MTSEAVRVFEKIMLGRKMCSSFLSTSFARNINHSDKSRANYTG